MEPDVLLVVVLAGIAAALLVLGVFQTLRTPSNKQRFEDALSDMQSGELHDLDMAFAENRPEKASGWFSAWRIRADNAGQVFDNPNQPGWNALRNMGVAAVFGLLIFPGGVVGLVALPIVFLMFQYLWLGAQAKKRIATMEKQLPLLLSGLRSYLQAGSTPQQAIISVADEIPAPLGDELRVVKQSINVAVPLDEALRQLSQRVPSREMQFLASSIEIAVRSGANLEPQLETIEAVVAQRARLRSKLSTAIASVRPTQIAATVAVPVFFLNSLRDEQNRAFWLSPNSLTFVVLVVFSTVFGLWGIRVLIKRIEAM